MSVTTSSSLIVALYSGNEGMWKSPMTIRRGIRCHDLSNLTPLCNGLAELEHHIDTSIT